MTAPGPRRLPLKVALFAPFLGLFLAVSLAWGLSVRNSYRAVESVAYQLADEISQRIRLYVTETLAVPHRLHRLNARALARGRLDPQDPEGMAQHFYNQLQEYPNLAFLFLGTPQGGAVGAGRLEDGTLVVDSTGFPEGGGVTAAGPVAGTRREWLATPDGGRGPLHQENPGFDARQRPWFQAAVARGGATWSPVYWLFADRRPAIAASLPVYGEEGQLVAVLGADLTLAALSDFLHRLPVGQTGEAFLMLPDGELLATSAPPESPGGALIHFAAEHLRQQATIPDSLWRTVERQGAPHFLTVTPLNLAETGDTPDLDWRIVTIVPRSDFVTALDRHARYIALSGLGLLLLALTGAALTARWIGRPVERLSRASAALAEGPLQEDTPPEAPLPGGRIREVEALATAFQRMRHQLRTHFGELEARVRQRTAELRQAKEVADRANRAKSDFLANVSHDVRTPLAAILGYAELLSQPDVGNTEEAQRYLRTIRNQGRHLDRLLSDLLDLSRIEAGRLELDVQPCSLPDLLADLTSAFQPRAVDKGLRFACDTAALLPAVFDADALRLRQVLSNLLANAIKFTADGSVTLAVRAVPEDAESTALHFAVADTGIGIPEARQQVLFQRFTQEKVDAGPRGGVGLGLAIVRELTERMGGRVTVESRSGEGACFRVSLPVTGCADWSIRTLPRLPAVGLPSAQLPTLEGRILIAEDSRELALLCQRLLERWGLQCRVVEDGQQAVLAAAQGTFDLILMDWHMPVQDGLSATRALRRLGIKTPVVALTAAAMAGDREACLAAGCTGYLEKPIDFKNLYRLIARLLDQYQGPVTGHLLPRKAGETPVEDLEIEALRRAYQARLPEIVEALRRKLQAADWTGLKADLHRLVGTAGSYGLDGVRAAAERLEALAAAQDAAGFREGLQAIHP